MAGRAHKDEMRSGLGARKYVPQNVPGVGARGPAGKPENTPVKGKAGPTIKGKPKNFL